MAASATTGKPSTSQPYDLLFKILMVGDSNVGKSSILLRFTDDRFDEEQLSTIGVDLKVKFLELRSKKIKATIWDSAGQERFRSLSASYYRGCQATILVYDVTRRETFDALQHWFDEITHHTANGKVVKVLVGNKIDLDKRVVTRQEGEMFAKEHGMLFLECSAKSRVGISQVFVETVNQIMDMPVDDSVVGGKGTKSKVDPVSVPQPNDGSCC